MTPQPTPHPAPRLDAIGLVVADMAASLAFYRQLGVDVPAAADAQPHVEATLPGGLRILWDTEETVRSFDPDWQPPQSPGRTGLCFVCGSPADVDATYDALVAAGHRAHLKPWDAVWGQRYATLFDPDGVEVSLFADAAAADDTA